MPQLSSTNGLLMAAKDMTDDLQNPHPEVPFASVGDATIAALTDLAAIFKLKLQQAPSPATHAPSCQGRPKPRPRSFFNPNLELARIHHAANEITDQNSHPRHPQRTITSKGGHTWDTKSITSEGVHWLPDTLAPQPVSRRLLRYGRNPHGHHPWK
jgi:hypothetical protein